MSIEVVVVGTDTDVGKTIFAAALVAALDGYYWKPVQAGLDGDTDTDIVRQLSGLKAERMLPELYRLNIPASPHFAAERDGVEIALSRLIPPQTQRPLVIEAAGGLAVPLTRHLLQIDLLARWKKPVVLCARTQLGTINHSLLSIEALKRRFIPILGVAFIGPQNTDSQQTICAMGGVKHLGRLPMLDHLTPDNLHNSFNQNFDVSDILGLGPFSP